MATILTINVGSATIKCALFTQESEPRSLLRETIDGAPASSMPRLAEWIDAHGVDNARAVGYRIVHGGPEYVKPHLVTVDLLRDLESLIPFAPNHLPDALTVVRTLFERLPRATHVACFDTAFHADLPDVARQLPIPHEYEALGVRRYGFHGLSYTFLVRELERLAGPVAADGRLVLAHLGNGSSLAAVRGRRSIDTTMGLTPIGGVAMSTRSGDLDPGVVTHIARRDGLTADQVETLLSHRSGLLGISGVSGDMRTLLERESADRRCRLAVDLYAYAIRKAIGGLAAALGGLETLVFAGGIGEHAPTIRARICDGLEFLGVHLDERENAANAPVISTAGSRVAVRVIPTDEELTIARAAHEMLSVH
jgi:acetate kinase